MRRTNWRRLWGTMPFDRHYPRDNYGRRPTAPVPEPLPLRPIEPAPEPPLWLRCAIPAMTFAVALVLLWVVWRVAHHL
jgi:hypothetical protein